MLELGFERNVNIYTKFPFLKILKMSYLCPSYFSGKLADYSILVKNDQWWKTFWNKCNVTIFRKKTVFFLPGSDKVLYLTPYFIFVTFWSCNVLFKIYHQTKNSLMIYNWSMLRKWISEVLALAFFLSQS